MAHDKIKKRNQFLKRAAKHKLLDGADKQAVAEGLMLDALKSYQREAERLIGYYYKARPL